jgi:hypothetical protein
MIRLLLHLYPAQWRAEYGEELAQVVASKPLTAGVLFNVLWNGIEERLRQSDPGIFFGLLLCCFVFTGNLMEIVRPSFATFATRWFGTLELLVLILAASYSALRSRSALRATFTAGGLSAISNFVWCVAWKLHILNPPQFCDPNAASVPGCGVTTLFVRSSINIVNDAFLVLVFLLFATTAISALAGGFLGWAIGRGVLGYRSAT